MPAPRHVRGAATGRRQHRGQRPLVFARNQDFSHNARRAKICLLLRSWPWPNSLGSRRTRGGGRNSLAPRHLSRSSTSGAGIGSKVEMGGGVHGIARPNLFTMLIESDPFAVADAMSAREDFVMAIRNVQRKGRVRRSPVVATRWRRNRLWHAHQAQCGVTEGAVRPRNGESQDVSIGQRRSVVLWHLRVV